jgi:signal transduction histidine kinase
MSQQSEPQRSASQTACNRLNVMIVEDDPDELEELRLLLEREGHTVACCTTVKQALTCLRRDARPDLIMLDLRIPGVNGWEFRVQQKHEAAWAGIPVIAMSGDHSAKAEAIDAVAYIRKPFDDRVILQTVERLACDLDQQRKLALSTEVTRMVSLGALLGGIAHEINNPLAIVVGNLELLRRQLLRTASTTARVEPFSVAGALSSLEYAQVGLERISSLMQSVSMFACRALEVNELLDVHAVLESSLQIASNDIRHDAKLERAYEGTPRVHGSAAKLTQVFLNLLLNAVSAIRTSQERDHVIGVSTSVSAEQVVIAIRDTATVLHAEKKTHMFNLLTTALSGRMGLQFGLAVSRELVEAMGGSLEVEPTQPRGVCFYVKLPLVTASPAAARPS